MVNKPDVTGRMPPPPRQQKTMESKVDPSASSLEQVRKILFGQQSRDLDSRIKQLEQGLKKDVQKLRS